MNFSPIFYEGQPDQVKWLCQRDKHLARVIRSVGDIKRRIWPEPYSGLLRAIIGQQISAKAQDSIWLRFCDRFPDFEPSTLMAAAQEQLLGCGISRPKASYMQGIAKAFAQGHISASALANMDDGQVKTALCQLKGVGQWTAEMLLIFTFQRPNVLSFDDLAIRRAMCRLYSHERVTREIFAKHFACYSPYSTLAGMYLWAFSG